MIKKLKSWLFYFNYGTLPHEHVLFTVGWPPYEACNYVESYINRDGYIKWRECKYKKSCDLCV